MVLSDVVLKQIDMPQCDAGAPDPVVIANEETLVFGYLLPAGSPSARCAIICLQNCSIFKFGRPNDEALAGHRYAGRGLSWYSAYEVLHSEWIEEMMVANRVHDRHSDSSFDADRHFIFTFHDSTLEAVCRDEPLVTVLQGNLLQNLLQEFQRISP